MTSIQSNQRKPKTEKRPLPVYLASRWQTIQLVFEIFRHTSGRGMASLEQDLARRWLFLVLLSLVIAIIITAPLRWWNSVSVTGNSTFWATYPSVITGLLVAISSVLALWVGAKQTRHTNRGYVIGILASVIAAFVSIESAAALTTALWSSGVVTATDTPVSLWATEQYYLREMAKSLGFLGVGDAVQWDIGVDFRDMTVGVIVITLKAVLLLPLVRFVTSAYRWLVNGPTMTLARDTNPNSNFDYIDAGGLFLACIWSAIFTLVCLVLTWSPPLTPVRWVQEGSDWLAIRLDERLPQDIVVPIIEKPLPEIDTLFGWAGASIQWLAVLIAMFICFGIFVALAAIIVNSHDVDLPPIGTALVVAVLWIPIAAALSAAATGLLVHSGLPTTEPPLAERDTRWSLVEYQLWGFVDAIPGLKATEAFGWARPLTVEGWPAVLFHIGFRLSALLLLVGIPWLVAAWWGHLRMAPKEVLPLHGAELLSEGLLSLEVTLSADRKSVGPASDALRQVKRCADTVRLTFGPGPVSSSAKAAVATAEECWYAVYGGFGHRKAKTASDLVPDAQARIEERRRAFVTVASAEMRGATPTP